MSNDNEKKSFKEWIKQNENKWISAGIGAICLAISMPITIYFASNSTLSAESFGKLGTVGDFLGGSTVGLLSIASIFFLISTIVMQRKELGMQREELQMTREELAKANEQYRITNETMKIQQFETTFFNMIQMHSSLIEGLNLYNTDLKGREVFIKLYESVNDCYHNTLFYEFILEHINNQIDNFDEFDNFYIPYVECLSKNYEITGESFSIYEKSELINIIINMKNQYYTNQIGQQIHLKGILYLDFKKLLFLMEYLEENMLINTFKQIFLESNKYKKRAYDIISSQYFYPLNNYFNSLNSLIDFVLNSKLIEEKERYLKIMASTFTPTEITILYYESLISGNKELEEKLNKIPMFEFGNALTTSIL